MNKAQSLVRIVTEIEKSPPETPVVFDATLARLIREREERRQAKQPRTPSESPRPHPAASARQEPFGYD